MYGRVWQQLTTSSPVHHTNKRGKLQNLYRVNHATVFNSLTDNYPNSQTLSPKYLHPSHLIT